MQSREQFYQKTWVVALFCIIACLLWGSAFPCVKIGYRLFAIPEDDTASQLLFAGSRFVLAGLLTILWSSIGTKKLLLPKKTDALPIFLLCLTQTIGQYIFYYIGLAHTAGFKAAILNGLKTFFVVLIAALLFRNERLTFRKIWGCVFGFAGVVLVNLSGEWTFSFSPVGEGFLIVSTLFSALASSLTRKFGQNTNPVLLSGWQFLLGGLVLTAVGALSGGHLQLSPLALLLLFYLAVISSVAFALTSVLLKYNPASRVQAFLTLNPVFGVILSALLLGEYETLGIQTPLALLCVMAGIVIIQRAPSESASKNEKNQT